MTAPPPPAAVLEARAVAGVPARLTAAAAVAVALVAAAAGTSEPQVAVWGVLTLALGVAIDELTGASAAFRSFPGALAGLVALAAVGAAWLVVALSGEGPVGSPSAHLLLLPLLGAALDFRLVARVRATVLLSGGVALPFLTRGVDRAALLAVAWLVLAVVALWLLQRDALATLPRPAPLTAVRPVPRRPLDLLRVGGLALAAAAVAALLVGSPSCETDLGGWLDGGLERSSDGGAASSGDPASSATEGEGEGSGSAPGSGGSSGASGEGSGDDGAPGSPSGRDAPAARPGEGGAQGSGERSGSSGALGVDPDVGGDGSTTGDEPADEGSSLDWLRWVLLAVVAVLVGLAAWVVLRWLDGSRTDDDGWTGSLVARLEREGARRGRPRGPGETVVAYCRALAAGPLPDPRLVEVGSVLSAALFAPAPPAREAESWAGAVVDDVVAANPVRSRGSRTATLR